MLERRLEFCQEHWSPMDDGRDLPELPGRRLVGIVPDLFAQDVPEFVVEDVLTSARSNPQHTFVAWTCNVERVRSHIHNLRAASGRAGLSVGHRGQYAPLPNFWVLGLVSSVDTLRHVSAVLYDTPLAVGGLLVETWDVEDERRLNVHTAYDALGGGHRQPDWAVLRYPLAGEVRGYTRISSALDAARVPIYTYGNFLEGAWPEHYEGPFEFAPGEGEEDDGTELL